MQSFESRLQFWSGLTLSMTLSLAGCGGSSTPQSQFVTDDAAQATATDQVTANPLATNEFDNRVTTTAGEVAATSPKTKKPGKPAPALDEEAAEDLAEEMEEASADELNVDEQAGEPQEGTPEYKLRQLALLKAAPVNMIRQPVKDKPGQFEDIKLTPEQAQQEQIRRWHTMVDVSIEVVSDTKKDPAQEQLFNNAVYYLTEARKQLALRGEPDQAQLLSEDAEALYKRDRSSFAAIESALRVVQLTQIQAEQGGRQDPKLAATFAKQSRLFAEKFPQETNRTAMNLMAAGRLCEQLGLMDDATLCYSTIGERYPNTPFDETTRGILRRLKLKGQKLEKFAGSTVDGGYISIDQFEGHPVLIAFWASNSQTFVKDLPQIQEASAKYGAKGLMVVGVSLDREQSAVDRFVDKHSLLAWNNIFFSDAESRGVQNPIARHYGVTTVPTYWLVNSKGIVVAAPLDLNQLDSLLSKTPVKAASNSK